MATEKAGCYALAQATLRVNRVSFRVMSVCIWFLRYIGLRPEASLRLWSPDVDLPPGVR